MSGTQDTRLTALIAALKAYGINVQPADTQQANVESQDGSSVLPNNGTLYDANLVAWAINAQGVITRNGVPDTRTANVTMLYYKAHAVHQRNAAGGWWVLDNNHNWQGESSPTNTVPPHPQSGQALPMSTGPMFTRGNQVVDAQGVQQRIASIGCYTSVSNQDMVAMRKIGFNCLRVSWVNASIDSDIPRMQSLAAGAKAAGMRIVFDNHTNEGGHGPQDNWGANQNNGLWFDSGPGTDGTDGGGNRGTVTDAKFTQDWVKVATALKGYDAVLGYDIRNEPHNWNGGAQWLPEDPNRDICAMYIRVGNAIHAVDPTPLIICAGSMDYPGNRAWGDLSNVINRPVALNEPNKVVYSVHDYPAYISGYTPDSGPQKVAYAELCWGYLIRNNIAPVWIGEMGGAMDNDSQRAWGNTLLDYMESFPKQPGDQPVSGDWWAWGQNDGDSPAGILLDRNTYAVRPEQKVYWQRLLFNR